MLCIYEVGDKKSTSSDDTVLDSFYRLNHFGFRIEDRQEWQDIMNKFNLPTFYGSPIKHRFSTSWYVQDPSGHEIEVSCWDNNEVRFK